MPNRLIVDAFKMTEEQPKPQENIKCSNSGRTLRAGQNILELREAIVDQNGTGIVPLPSSLYFSNWNDLLEYAKKYGALPQKIDSSIFKRRIP